MRPRNHHAHSKHSCFQSYPGLLLLTKQGALVKKKKNQQWEAHQSHGKRTMAETAIFYVFIKSLTIGAGERAPLAAHAEDPDGVSRAHEGRSQPSVTVPRGQIASNLWTSSRSIVASGLAQELGKLRQEGY